MKAHPSLSLVLLPLALVGCSRVYDPTKLAPDGGATEPRDGGDARDGGSCEAGLACTPAQACRKGETQCQGGVSQCVVTGTADDSTPCGAGQYCFGGVCQAGCTPGGSCALANACRKGRVDCTSGSPVCEDDGPQPNGTPCGTGKSCQGGVCQTGCVAGGSCALADPCRKGRVECVQGSPVCTDDGPQLNGAPCGTERSCYGGVCKPTCVPGVGCAPQIECREGQVACRLDGSSECQAAGFAQEGEPCGGGACHNGQCQAPTCTAGGTCSPGHPCRMGIVTCPDGQFGSPACADSGTDLPGGSVCGTDLRCNADGSCTYCKENEACTLATCRVGKYACANGSYCQETGTAPAGTPCGSNMYCDASQHCSACTPGEPCVLEGSCRVTQISCATGHPVCAETSNNANDGTVCGTNRYCQSGACGDCTPGAACAPAAPDDCKRGTVACATGRPVCVEGTDSASDGTPCSVGTCTGGTCVTRPVLSIVSGGGQSVLPGQTFASVLKVKVSTQTGAPLQGATVRFAVPPGAVADPAHATTNVMGLATTAVTAGRRPGPLPVVVSAAGADSLTDTATVTEPAAGTVLPVVNAPHVFGQQTTLPAAGIKAVAGRIYGLAAAADGTLYYGDLDAFSVYKLTPEGVVTRVLGTGESGNDASGNYGTQTRIWCPFSLALDADNQLLYVLDSRNKNVRMVDLASNYSEIVAGGGTAGAPGFGDGGPATSAQLSNPASIAVGPDHAIYISDMVEGGGNFLPRFRRVPSGGGTITNWLEPANRGFANNSTQVAWHAGKAFVQMRYPYGDGSSPYSVLRVDGTTDLVRVLGGPGESGTLGGYAPYHPYTPVMAALAFDPAGNLFVGQTYNVFRVDGASLRTSAVAGAETGGSTGDFGPASAALFDTLGPTAFDAAGHLYLVDTGNFAVRMIWRAGALTPSTATLALQAGNDQSVRPFETLPVNPAVTLSDGAGAPLSQFQVTWAATPGAGVSTPTSNTNVLGRATMVAWPGLAVGAYTLTASFRNLHGAHIAGSPVTFTENTIAPEPGTGFPAVNVGFSLGWSGIPGSARAVQIANGLDAQVASDGTVYLLTWLSPTDGHILKMTPAGHVTDLTPGGLGTGPSMRRMVLDEPRNRIVYKNGYRIHAFSLADRTVTLLAGTGVQEYSGDGGSALAAGIFTASARIAVGSDGSVYFVDVLGPSSRIRRVTPAGVMEVAFTVQTCPLDGISTDSPVAVDAGGNLLFQLAVAPGGCGTGNEVTRLVRLPPGGTPQTVVRMSGRPYGVNDTPAEADAALADGVAGAESRNDYISSVVPAPNGDVYFTARAGLWVTPSGDYLHRVRKYSAATGLVTTVAGLGTPTAPGSATPGYAAATTQALGDMESAITRTPDGHLWIAQYNAFGFRLVW